MALRLFRRKKDKKQQELDETQYAPLREQSAENNTVEMAARHKAQKDKEIEQSIRRSNPGRRHVVELCEEIIDMSRNLETKREEYQKVTSELNDVMMFESLSEDDMVPILDSVRQIQKLEKARSELLEIEKKLTDTQFAQMQEEEANIPGSVKRLKSNEAYLDAIKRDMNFLEGEKVEWGILRQECEQEQKFLQRLSFFLLAVFSLAILILLIVRLYMDYDIALMLLIVAFIATLIGAYILFKYQDCTKEIKRCDVNRNQAIALENHVKLKYVNIKNAVDYTCEKYHVNNAYELTYMYEQFQTMVRDQERFKQTNDDLTYYTERLIVQLDKKRIDNTQFWVHYTDVFSDKKELASYKANLLTKRQLLRNEIEENMESIEEMKKEVINSTRYMGEISDQVKQILARIDELNNN